MKETLGRIPLLSSILLETVRVEVLGLHFLAGQDEASCLVGEQANTCPSFLRMCSKMLTKH